MNKLVLNGSISTWWISAEYVRRELEKMSGDIEVHISSYGGDFYEGMEIFNLLREYSNTKGKVTTVNISKAMSAGSHIFLAGDVRKAYSNATIMCHCAWTFAGGDVHDMKRQANILDGIDNIQASIYKKYVGGEIEDIKAKMRDEMWYIGEEQLLASGMIDEIIEVEELPSDMGTMASKYSASMREYKTALIGHESKQTNLEEVEASISACMGNCTLATVPSTEKTANSNQGEDMPKENTDVSDPSIEAKSEVDGEVGASAEVLAQIRADEAKRIQDVSAIIPNAHRDNSEVQAKLFDPETTVEAMKAFLYDMNAQIATKAKEDADAQAGAVDEAMISIDSASDVGTEKEDGGLATYAEKHRGSIK